MDYRKASGSTSRTQQAHVSGRISSCLSSDEPSLLLSFKCCLAIHPSFLTQSVEGNDISIGLLECAWQSSTLLTEMTKIMIEESLGYHARVDSRIGANGASPIYALAGCVDFDDSTSKQCLIRAAEAFSRSCTCRYSGWRCVKSLTMIAASKVWPERHTDPRERGLLGWKLCVRASKL